MHLQLLKCTFVYLLNLFIYADLSILLRLQEVLIIVPPFILLVLLLSEMHPSRRLRKAVGKQTVLRRGVYPRRGPSASRNRVLTLYCWEIVSDCLVFYEYHNVAAVYTRSECKCFVFLSDSLSLEGGEGSGPYRHSNGTMSVASEEDSSGQRSTETSQPEITLPLLVNSTRSGYVLVLEKL